MRGPEEIEDFKRLASRFIPACAGTSRIVKDERREPTVHPRVCGDQRWKSPTIRRVTGSSPRVRGPDGTNERTPPQNRFIPACAGTSDFWRSDWRDWTVHPRVCGDQRAPLGSPWCASGSSPRVRGPAGARPKNALGLRFIPACAGTSPRLVRLYRSQPVHPRVCGDQARHKVHL